jgi:exodeoxyribonuclease III
MSWNVAGLRALVRKQPDALADIATRHNIDVLCLQETKLQNDHVTDPKLKLKGHILEEQGYDSYWSCSTAKKGYSGTAVFIKRREITTVVESNSSKATTSKKKQATLGAFFDASTNPRTSSNDHGTKVVVGDATSQHGDMDIVANLVPLQVTYSMGKEEHDSEGRIITMDFPLFTLANVYVPNSGQNLERLSYRTKQWDKDLLEFMKQKEEQRGLPVIWLGDLNVAHKAYDCWNDGAKHLEKQAGTTKEEKESFQMQLDTGGGAYVDAFRHLYPEAKGHYTYWSQRAGNRAPNKGLRLDYFICSKRLFQDTKDAKVLVRDSYMIPEQEGSDHCPVILELEIRK